MTDNPMEILIEAHGAMIAANNEPARLAVLTALRAVQKAMEA